MGRLIEVGEAILRNARVLEEQLEAASAAPRTLDTGGPMLYPGWSEYPDMFQTRSALIEASREMHQLALGPGDAIRSIIGPKKMEAFVLNVIERYNIASLVPKQGSITIEDLASKVSVQSEILERILRFAFSMNVFKIDRDGQVSHTAMSEAIETLAEWSRLMNRREVISALSSWPESLQVYSETSACRLPWNIGNDIDTSLFDFLTGEKDGMEQFGRAMKSHTAVAGADTSYIVNGFDWKSLGSGPIVDIGGGNGHIAVMLAEAFPDIHVIVQDLSLNEEGATSLIAANLKERVIFQVQDFFKPQTQTLQAKAFFMRAIMHDWPDNECIKILRNLLPEVEMGAKIIICDRVTPPRGQKPTQMESFTLFMDLMVFSLLGAKERSIEQWQTLIRKTDPRLQILSLTQPFGSEYGLFVIGM